MGTYTTALTVSTTLLIGQAGLMPALAEEEGQAPAPAVEAVEQATVSVSGKLVLPKEAEAEEIELAKLKGTVQFQLPRVEPPFPDGFAEMSQDEKRAWFEAFRDTDEYAAYVEKARARNAEQREMLEIEIAFEDDGSFTLEGLKPGDWALTAQIPHPRSDRHWGASIYQTITVPADQDEVALDPIELNVTRLLLPGDMAPDFTATKYDGTTFKLSDYRGRYVLVDFWATWCGPCIGAIPHLEKVYKDFAGERFEIIGLSLDAKIEAPKKFHEERPSGWVHGHLGDWNTSQTPKDYGVKGIPSIWLIGPDGKIVARDLRGQRMYDAVQKAVKGEGGTN